MKTRKRSLLDIAGQVRVHLCELALVVKVCTRPVQVQVKQNPSMERTSA